VNYLYHRLASIIGMEKLRGREDGPSGDYPRRTVWVKIRGRKMDTFRLALPNDVHIIHDLKMEIKKNLSPRADNVYIPCIIIRDPADNSRRLDPSDELPVIVGKGLGDGALGTARAPFLVDIVGTLATSMAVDILNSNNSVSSNNNPVSSEVDGEGVSVK
jgi:hypothetical protein